MATSKKKTVQKKAAAKTRSIPTKLAKPKVEAIQVITESKISKKAQIHALLERPEGATIAEMMKQTNWQSHTVRGFLSMQKKAGKSVTSERIDGLRVYYIPKDE